MSLWPHPDDPDPSLVPPLIAFLVLIATVIFGLWYKS